MNRFVQDPGASDAPTVEADYVVVGAGAVGMAFADSLLSASRSSMIIVDRRHKPGGHWHDSYPFIRLHSPAASYGVNSLPLDDGTLDTAGPNKGLLRLASGAEVCSYFDRVMQQRLLPSGRVTYLPMSELVAPGEVRSLSTGRRLQVRARSKWVDASLADTQVPATHGPAFAIAEGVRWTTPSGLARLSRPYAGYVIVGGGKTALDTASWLLGQGVPAQHIVWIRPREAWLLNRAKLQPGDRFFSSTIGAAAEEMESAQQAESIDDLFFRLEAAGLLQRIDRKVTPTMFRCAVVSEAELEQLRRIERVVRLGHVTAIETHRIVLQHGEIPTSPDHLHIHCSAAGLPRGPLEPIFQPGRIVPQYVRRCSPSFSAALVAKLEATLDDDDEKNAMCLPIAPPSEPLDWLHMHLRTAHNQQRWSRVPGLYDWLCGSRLDTMTGVMTRAAQRPEAAALLQRCRQARRAGLARLEQLLQS